MAERGPVDRFLRRTLDPRLASVFRRLSMVDFLPDPAIARLSEHREEAMRRAAAELEPRAAELSEGVVARDPEVIRRYDELIDEAVARMRAARPEETGGYGALSDRAILGLIDRRFYKNDPERLDDPNYPEAERSEALDQLDRFNRAIGAYDVFIGIIMPLIEEAERRIAAEGARRPVRLHDLASGHAGFAIMLKEALGDRVEVEASDIKPEYLELGRARAEALGVRIDLFTEDALAMDGPKARGVDILLCTQALHHFPLGMVARMVGEASRAARVGACFIDGERSVTALTRFLVAAPIYTRHWTLVHDGIVSLRRMFRQEELSLLAALAPGLPEGVSVETGRSMPAHCYLRVTVPAARREVRS